MDEYLLIRMVMNLISILNDFYTFISLLKIFKDTNSLIDTTGS